ncbi:hypothetical protein [Thomasclavelia sp.]|uniref:hypothetical protein n=1 Tax=Thomasclavelia sp. TaxID=3025757 RepID=UPI0025D301B6|nr:hypothetical protein [Thomasclavelia sp.]
MDINKLKRKFPSYFQNFKIPEWAEFQELEVYRACRSGKVDRESFLNSYEEHNFLISKERKNDPQEYSLSTYTKYKDVRRFMAMTSDYGIPFVIAKGITHPICGPSLETRIWKKHLGIKYRGSHVDWWLFTKAKPWEHFKEVKNNEH